MLYTDLSSYSHNLKKSLPDVMNIGWLDKSSDYKTGSIGNEFIEKLIAIYLNDDEFNGRTKLARSTNAVCNICGCVSPLIKKNGISYSIDLEEIWIPSIGNGHFASPAIVIHYIIDHSYVPPDEYIQSVLAVDLKSPYSAQEIWLKKVLE